MGRIASPKVTETNGRVASCGELISLCGRKLLHTGCPRNGRNAGIIESPLQVAHSKANTLGWTLKCRLISKSSLKSSLLLGLGVAQVTSLLTGNLLLRRRI